MKSHANAIRVDVSISHSFIQLTFSWGHSSGILYSNMVFLERRFLCGSNYIIQSGDIIHGLSYDQLKKLDNRIVKYVVILPMETMLFLGQN